MIRLERIIDALPCGLETMRAEAQAEGFGMLEVLAADWASGKTRFDHEGEALFAAYVEDELAGIGGVTLDPFTPGALQMRRFYVRTVHRRRGAARAIALALLAHCEDRIVTVNAARGSETFYESIGFAPDAAERRTHVLKKAGT
jgi:GNAT superfamily N-acetyltransferase